MEEIKYKFNEKNGNIYKRVFVDGKIRSVLNISAINRINLKSMIKKISLLEQENKNLNERLNKIEDFINGLNKLRELSFKDDDE